MYRTGKEKIISSLMRHAPSLKVAFASYPRNMLNLAMTAKQSHSTQGLPRYARNDSVAHLVTSEEARRSNLMNIKRLFHNANIYKHLK